MTKGHTMAWCAIAILALAPLTAVAAEKPPAAPAIEARISDFNAIPGLVDGAFSCPNGGPVLLDQPPNQANGIFSDGDCAACGTGQQSLAEDFILAADASIEQIVMWGGYFPGNLIPGSPDPLTVIFHQDTAGLPGAVINTQTPTPSSATTTGNVLFGVSEIEYVIDIAPVALTAGTYWVEIFTNSVGNSDNFFWESGNQDVTNGRFNNAFATATPGATWMTGNPTGDNALALCGSGTPSLNIGAATSTDQCEANPGNENGIWEPGEGIFLDVNVGASGGGDHTNISCTISSTSAGVTMVLDTSTYPDLLAGTSSIGDMPFLVLLEGASCFDTLDFDVDCTSNQGMFSGSFSQGVGQGLMPNVPLAIPDNSPAGVDSDLVVADNVVLSDVDVRVQIDHTWVGDLILTLTSPASTSVVLLDRPGVPVSANGCLDDNMDVTFDDASGFDPEPHCAGTTPWFSGTAAPVGSLASFNGEMSAGTWTLTVSDNAGQDLGTIVDWELITDPPIGGTCVTCDDAGPPFGGGGPVNPIIEIPTMDTVGLVTLVLLLGGTGLWIRRRRDSQA